MVYFLLERYCTNQLISLSEFPVIYGLMDLDLGAEKIIFESILTNLKASSIFWDIWGNIKIWLFP